MKDKYLIVALVILIPVVTVMTIRNVRNYAEDEKSMQSYARKLIKVNVLPENKDKELRDPKEVRQYVLSVARAEGLNVNTVDRVISCESKYNIYARNRTSTAKGLAQFLDGTWRNNCEGDVFNAQHNTKCFMDNFKKYPSWWEECL